MEKTVRTAGTYEYDAKKVYAELIIPQDLQGSSYPNAIVEERNENGKLYIYFETNFVPDRESPEYYAYVQKVLNELRDRTIARCGRK